MESVPEGDLARDIETPEADAIEQHEEVVATEVGRPSSDIEVDDGDRLEQAQIVATDDEDEGR
jgi:hypothetical protein